MNIFRRLGAACLSSLSLACLSCEATFGSPAAEGGGSFSFGEASVYVPTKNRSYATRTLAPVAGEDARSPYGGDARRTLTATGFFRAQSEGGRWFLVDPAGHPYFSIGLNSVKAGGGRSLPAELKAAGFTGVGNWSDETVPSMNGGAEKIPYTLRFNFMAGFKDGSPYLAGLYGAGILPVFDPGFAPFCELFAARVEPFRDDPWLLGYFSDNELPFYNGSASYGDVLDRFLGLPEADANRRHAASWLAARGRTASNFDGQDEEDFAAHVVGVYYETVSKALKARDPNHLYLGTRFHGGAKSSAAIFRAAGPWVDVFSVNYYDAWSPSAANMDMWVREGGKPFIVTEYYVKGQDTGMANAEGAGWVVRSQADRGLFYAHWVMSLMSHPGAVGAHWFKYSDEGGSSNKGMLDSAFRWYEPLRSAALNVNRRIYSLVDELRAAP